MPQKRDRNGNPVPDISLPTATINPVTTPVGTSVADIGFITASLLSLDTGKELRFHIEPSEFDIEGSTVWEKPGVIFGSPQPLEYRTSNPKLFTIHAYFDGYTDFGEGGTIRPELDLLEEFRHRVPGKNRAHVLMYVQGATTEIGVLIRYSATVRRLSRQGAFIQALDVPIQLEKVVFLG